MKTTKVRNKIFIILCVIIITLSFPTNTFALTPSPQTTVEERNLVAWDWSYNQRGYRDYNCLSWALGNTTTWTWPWGEQNPTVSQVTTFLSAKGYRVVGNTVNYSADIYAYGFGTEVVHFGRKYSSLNFVMSAKWGVYEVFNHTSLVPYYNNRIFSYGAKLADYVKL